MKPTVILYIAISRDGFIADKNGGVDWLNPFSTNLPPDADSYGYPAFFESIDFIVMGRNTYEQMLTFGDWPNAGKHTYVFTESNEIPPREDISFTTMDPGVFIQQMDMKHPGCRIWLEGGAQLVQSFYDVHLIDEYIIAIIPIDLGQGIALPKGILRGEGLIETGSKTYSNHVVQKYYKQA